MRRTGGCHAYREADMAPPILETRFTWLSLVGTKTPPRDPNNNDGEHEDEDEDDGDEKREPPVIRDSDEDE
jgi:hypothetical protein